MNKNPINLSFRKPDLVFVFFISLIFTITLIIEIFFSIELIGYFIAFLLIVCTAMIILLVRSLRNEVFQRFRMSEKENESELNSLRSSVSELNENAVNRLKSDMGVIYTQIESLLSIHSIIDQIRYPLPGFRKWAISPDSMSIVVSQILDAKPGVLVEFGSGSSTIIMGYCLEKLKKGRLISIDHSLEYSRKTKDLLRNHGLTDYVEVIHCPLKPYNFNGKDYLWYSLDFNLIPKTDFVLIDGPPTNIQKTIRYPALPLMYEHLNENALILIDDGQREGDKEVVETWLNEYKNIKPEFIDTEKGLYLLRNN